MKSVEARAADAEDDVDRLRRAVEEARRDGATRAADLDREVRVRVCA